MEKAVNDSMKKIVIIGAESTGKTVLCEQLAKHYNTVYVPEYARTYFNEHDINNYDTSDLEIIAKNQLDLEKELSKKATNYLFCDTSLITVKIWSTHKFNKVPAFITQSIKPTDYDLYLVSNNDVEWIEDPQRRNEGLRDHLFKWNIHELQKLSVDYQIITGTGEERLNSTIALIDSTFNAKK
jgi:NadR type nicotinamide-nucleotide adenylyltransferase